jgi:glycosyltransferase involved in cell wall biosynthesis
MTSRTDITSAGPTVTVIVPLFDHRSSVERAVRSVLFQTVPDLEVIVVNDGSTDGGAELVRSIPDARVRVIDQANQGVAAARNAGMRAARAPLLAFLDADDQWDPDFLATILALRRSHPEAKVFATSYRVRRRAGSRANILRGLPRGFESGVLPDYFAVASRSEPPVCASAVAIEAAALQAIDGFPEGVRAGEDLLTWARLAARHSLAYSRTPKAEISAAPTARRPKRAPQVPDLVGPELQRLKAVVSPGSQSFRQYVALWHRMRALLFLQLGRREESLSDVRLALRESPSAKLHLLLVLATAVPRLASAVLHGRRAVLRLLRDKAGAAGSNGPGAAPRP